MMYKEKSLTLKNGQSCIIRSPAADDAEGMLSYLKQSYGETEFVGRHADEVTFTVEEERKTINDMLADPAGIMISAFVEGRLVSNISFARVSTLERYRHRAVFGMSVCREFWGLGVGSALLDALLESSPEAGIEQLELEVIAENERALALYRKFGFELYGTRERSVKQRDGRYMTNYLMLRMV